MSRKVKWITTLIGIWVAVTMLYYSNVPNRIINEKSNPTLPHYNGSEDFLIDTPGCTIPNYAKTLKFHKTEKARETCGERAVFIERISNDKISFIIDKNKLIKHDKKSKDFECCYGFGRRSDIAGEENDKLIYTPCSSIKNETMVELMHEVITVKCVNKHQKIVYEDSYIILKKLIEVQKRRRNKKSWNVLILGLDTMSRARAYSSLPRTVKYLKENDWLDYSGYQKVASNTFPNLMALLTGKNASSAYSKCQKHMQACNDVMMWSNYRRAGYATAYGEDYIGLPDTFSKNGGFKTPPTDHYMRPFFLTGEKQKGNFECTEKVPSAINVLNYAYDFVSAYRHESFFGFFWINSCSHNLQNLPTLFERDLVSFFGRLNSTGVLNNTFVIFLSDHGIRFGPTRVQKETYFEERLPMLFIWVPIKFKYAHVQEFYSLQTNQYRLVTPYDLYATLGSILQMTTNGQEIYRAEACLKCASLFEETSPERNCLDAAVDDKWCTCHGEMVDSMPYDLGANRSLQIAVEYIQTRSKNVETTPCTVCSQLTLKSVLRMQSYRNEIDNSTIYVTAFVMKPGDVGYEVSIKKHGDDYTILQPTDTISKYNVKGSCAKNPNNRPFCVCKNIKCRN